MHARRLDAEVRINPPTPLKNLSFFPKIITLNPGRHHRLPRIPCPGSPDLARLRSL